MVITSEIAEDYTITITSWRVLKLIMGNTKLSNLWHGVNRKFDYFSNHKYKSSSQLQIDNYWSINIYYNKSIRHLNSIFNSD